LILVQLGVDKAFDARPLWTTIARLGPHPKILAIPASPGSVNRSRAPLKDMGVEAAGLVGAGYLQIMRSGAPLNRV